MLVKVRIFDSIFISLRADLNFQAGRLRPVYCILLNPTRRHGVNILIYPTPCSVVLKQGVLYKRSPGVCILCPFYEMNHTHSLQKRIRFYSFVMNRIQVALCCFKLLAALLLNSFSSFLPNFFSYYSPHFSRRLLFNCLPVPLYSRTVYRIERVFFFHSLRNILFISH